MKKILYIIVIIISFSSCTQEVSCEGFTEKELVKSILKEQILKRKIALKMVGMKNIEEYVDKFFNKNVKFELIRTTAKNKELKSCECVAKLKFYLDKKIQKKFDSITDVKNNEKINNENKKFLREFNNQLISDALATDGIDIIYKLQKTTDDKIIAETYDNIINQLLKVIGSFYTLEKKLGNTKIDNSKVLHFRNNSDEYSIYFLKNNNLKIIFKGSGGYTEQEIAKYKNGRIIVKQIPTDYPISKDKIYILEKNILKVYNPEIDNYDIYKR